MRHLSFGLLLGFILQVTADLESDLVAIRSACSTDELEKGNNATEVSQSCKSTVEERMKMQAAHNNSNLTPSNIGGVIARNRGEEPCDGVWTDATAGQTGVHGCCKQNRFGSTGPSPICRGLLMNNCDCRFDADDNF